MLTFGLAALLATAASVAVIATHQEGQVIGISVAAALIVWGIYARLVYARWAIWRRVKFTTDHGLRVVIDLTIADYSTAESLRLGIEAATEDALIRWENAGCAKARGYLRDCFLVLKPYPFELHDWTGKYRGVTLRNLKAMLVGYRTQMPTSALGHEIGHVVLREWGKPWDEAALRKWATEKGVPY